MASTLTPLILDLDFVIYGEDHDDRLWLHCNVFSWNHKTKLRLQEAAKVLLRTFKQDLWVCAPPGNVLLPKFLQSLHFEPAGPVNCHGEVCQTFVRSY